MFCLDEYRNAGYMQRNTVGGTSAIIQAHAAYHSRTLAPEELSSRSRGECASAHWPSRLELGCERVPFLHHAPASSSQARPDLSVELKALRV